MATKYETDRAAIWMIQVRLKNSDRPWTPTGRDWFFTRKETWQYIADNCQAEYLNDNEYRACKYAPFYLRQATQ